MHRAPKVRIAIAGGGISGASLLHALCPLDHLDVHLFEANPQFREEDVAFGIGRNATAALDLIGPSSRKCLERAGGVRMQGSSLWIGQGEGSAEKVFQLDNSSVTVQRIDLLRELLADLPAERLHVSKELIDVERLRDGSVLLHFLDGSTHECDIIIGADGVHSTVRLILLGEHDIAAFPQRTDWWSITSSSPYEKVQDSVPVDVEDGRQCAWAGNASFMTSNILNHGETAQFSITSSEKLPLESREDISNIWSRTVSKETLKNLYLEKGWLPHLSTAVQELFCDQPTRQATSLWEQLPAHTYVSGPIALIGDAAHAATPFMGSDGGMCAEDTLIMSSLLARAYSPAEARLALKIYDNVRRPRTQRVVEASHMTGNLITGKNVAVGLDAEKLKTVLQHRWDFIFNFDNMEHRDEAVAMLEKELKRDCGEEAWIPEPTTIDPTVPEVLVL